VLTPELKELIKLLAEIETTKYVSSLEEKRHGLSNQGVMRENETGRNIRSL